MAVSDYSTTPASNTAIGGIDITGATGLVSQGDNAIRQFMADVKAGVITGYTTTATAAGTTVLTVASNSYQYFTGTTTQTITMPVTSTLELGRTFVFVNNSTGAVTVNSSGGNAIVVLPGSTSAWVTCILLSGTSAASWSVAGAYATRFLAADGTAALPSIGFASDPDSGMYSIGANNLGWAVNGAIELDLNSTRLAPGASDGSALGSTTLMWADLFLALGGVINWDNGDVTVTHSANTLAFAGASSGYTFDASISVSGQAVLTAATGQARDADLTAIAALAGTGIAVRTAANTWAQRSVEAGTGILMTNGDGVAGNPSVAVNFASQAEQETATSVATAVSPGRQQFHPSAAKVWASVTVNAGVPTLSGSFNMTSITDNGVGDITFTIATYFSSGSNAYLVCGRHTNLRNSGVTAVGTGTADGFCVTTSTGAAFDPNNWYFTAFGDQ